MGLLVEAGLCWRHTDLQLAGRAVSRHQQTAVQLAGSCIERGEIVLEVFPYKLNVLAEERGWMLVRPSPNELDGLLCALADVPRQSGER